MKDEPLVSVIVPVWNVAPYLKEALDSLSHQTYAAWEAVCVDDGSTDGSSSILDAYAARDKRFRVFHLSHGGVSAARNRGLDESRGAFIAFLDADDTLSPRSLERAVEAATSHPHAVVAWGKIGPHVWNRLYPRDLIGTVRFSPALSIGEDRVFLLELEAINKVRTVLIKEDLYFHRIRPDSLDHHPLGHEDFIQRRKLVEAELAVFGADEAGRLDYCRHRLFGQLKMFYCQLARVIPTERPAARDEFIRLIRSLRDRNYLCGSWRYFKYYLIFCLMSRRMK